MENKHSAADLKQMQSLPLEAKILMTERRIQDWYDHWNGDVYVSFSGGKDSTVLKHIVDQLYDDVPAVFVNTGLEYPEIQAFVQEIKAGKYDCFNTDVKIIRPELRFDEVIRKYGYPVISKQAAHAVNIARRHPNGLVAKNQFDPERTSLFSFYRWKSLVDAPFLISDKCCYYTKKKPGIKYARESGRKIMTGMMAEESKLRYSQWLAHGCNAYDAKEPSSSPLSFWSEQDVLHYIKRYHVPVSSVYGEIRQKLSAGAIENQISIMDCFDDYTDDDILETTGCKRTGCIFCLFG